MDARSEKMKKGQKKKVLQSVKQESPTSANFYSTLLDYILKKLDLWRPCRPFYSILLNSTQRTGLLEALTSCSAGEMWTRDPTNGSRWSPARRWSAFGVQPLEPSPPTQWSPTAVEPSSPWNSRASRSLSPPHAGEELPEAYGPVQCTKKCLKCSKMLKNA